MVHSDHFFIYYYFLELIFTGMKFILLKIDSPEWNYIWSWLEAHPINAGLEDPKEALYNGQAWEYLGSFIQGPRCVHTFRHLLHPKTNKIEELSLSASSTFNSDDIAIERKL